MLTPMLPNIGGKTKSHKGRAKHYLTEAEIQAEEERKKKELEWKVMAAKGQLDAQHSED